MKRIFFPFIAIIAGFGLAFLAASVSSLFFIILPVAAFGLGYFSSWRWGITCGFLLFASYTFALTFIWWGPGSPNLYYPVSYVVAFIGGGFSLLLIGSLAPFWRRKDKKAVSVAALVILVATAGWCGYTALPRYGYYYQVTIQSTENLSNLEVYLPAGTVSGKPYEKLYHQPYEIDHLWMAPDIFTPTLVKTDQGEMLRIYIANLKKEDHSPQPNYVANLIFWQKAAPDEPIQLLPKSGVVQVNEVTLSRSSGPVKIWESRITERFQVPIKIAASSQAPVKVTLLNRTDRDKALNFTYTYRKSEPYTEKINSEIETDGEWKLIPVEATSLMEIHGSID